MDFATSKDNIIKTEEEDEAKANKRLRRSIIKNVLLIGVSFFFLFTSYNSMAYLQSSINPDMGTNSLSVIYASLILSCIFVPSVLIDKLKEKKTMGFSMWGYLLYIAAQFHPTSYTLLPTAAIVGLCAAPLWSAKCTYLTHIARKYAEAVGENPEVIVTRFFGVFFFFFQNTVVWGSLISSTVLSTDPTIVEANDTERLSKCGSNYCPGSINDSVDLSSEVSKAQRYTMSSIYLICAATASIILLVFLDPLSKFKTDEENNTKGTSLEKTGKELLKATASHLKKPFQLLIIPLTIWSGIEQAFFGADFTASYVACGLGVYMVGYVLICYGVCDALSCIICSHLVKKISRIPVFIMGAVINAAIIITLLAWSPNPDYRISFFIIAGLWGVADGVWQTQINAFYGVLFPKTSEAAFSNYRLWESLGFIIAYICSGLLCTESKIYIMIASLSLGIVGYITIEVIIKWELLPKHDDGEYFTIMELVKKKSQGNKVSTS